MFHASPFFENWEEKTENYRLLADSAYISNNFPFIVTPTRDDGVLTEEDMNQNTALSRGRVLVPDNIPLLGQRSANVWH